MTTFSTKSKAQNKANEINSGKGYSLYSPVFVGEAMSIIEGVPCKGWYLVNKESKKWF